MPFFIKGKNKSREKTVKKPLKPNKKRFAGSENESPALKKTKLQKESDNDEITSDEDEAFINEVKEKQRQESSKFSNFSEETAQEKKERLAKKYIEELKEQYRDKEDEDEIHKEVGLRLKRDVLEASGTFQKSIAHNFDGVESVGFFKNKHHKRPLTCLTITSDEKFIFTGSKDCTIIKWSIDGTKIDHIGRVLRKNSTEQKNGHSSHILCLAVSSDGKYLASGDQKGIIHIWDCSTLDHLKTFSKHRKAVSGLVFRKETNTLYSASHDRMVMSWSLDAMAFAESFGGHQDYITAIDALQRESCITSGGRDKMIIVYVMTEDKQLRFTSSQTSVDGVKLLNEKIFVSFGQDGSLALWSTQKKKAKWTVHCAHGTDAESGEPNWILSVATLINTDIIASGSSDGCIRLWKVTKLFDKLELLESIEVKGFVNYLEFTKSGTHLVAGIGKEPKLGRWNTDKTCDNALVIISLNFLKEN